MSESELQARVMLAIGAQPGIRVFRNTVGTGWHGEVVEHGGGMLLLRNPRAVTFGLCTGSGDAIGWQDGRFLSLEFKTLTGKLRTAQVRWAAAVAANGGLHGVIRSVDDAKTLLRI